jgi:soluble lytic murein transglycosylase
MNVSRINRWLLLTLCVLLPAWPSAAGDRAEFACDSPEHCYEIALQSAPADKSPEQRRQATLKHLETLRERYPATAWARRARVLSGLILAEQDPAKSAQLFAASYRDLHVLEDYLRLWTAEALLRTGEIQQAADLAESIQQAVPDTILRTRAALLTGAAWYKAGECQKATELLTPAAKEAPHDPVAPSALLDAADCHLRLNQKAKAKEVLKEIWIRYPHSPEAQEVEARLARFNTIRWKPSPDDLYRRAESLLGQAYHEEAVGTIVEYLSRARKDDPRRDEMRLKLGTTLVVLKNYNEARRVFRTLAGERDGKKAGEATVWLARVYIAQEDNKALLDLFLSLPTRSLTHEQTATIQSLVASQHDDQERVDEAIAGFRHVAQTAQNPTQRSEALWRIGWIQYRTGRFREAVATFEEIMDDPQFAPQALYRTARALDRVEDVKAADHYLTLCQRYAFTYQCQLAKTRTHQSGLIAVSTAPKGAEPAAAPARRDSSVARNVHYHKAVELKHLAMDHEAAQELVWLAEHYAGDRAALVEISTMLGEAGAYQHALRLAKLHFTEGVERDGAAIPKAVWEAAYPTAYLPTIRVHGGTIVDPYLVLAIIREESQYNTRALSAHGAVGLMQVMPSTVQAMAKQQGQPEVKREELFDRDTNIGFGVRYLEQLLQEFAGNIVHTVAAYNAGPHAVKGWIERFGSKEPDEFIELIPYQETRNYVKRVILSYREYRRLGGNACVPHFLDKAC